MQYVRTSYDPLTSFFRQCHYPTFSTPTDGFTGTQGEIWPSETRNVNCNLGNAS